MTEINKIPAHGSNVERVQIPASCKWHVQDIYADEAAWKAEGTMFYKMIERARDRWYASPDCTIGNIIDYMTRQGNL